MAASEDLIDFDIIENQKENIQSLPGGRSAKELARIFSPRDPSDKFSSPTPNDTRTLNDAIRQEYEAELQAIGESDDPLDIYDRYVKWVLNAYPSAQATHESGLLPLLERAVKSFLSSADYKNDPRYLRLWLHYIRLFSDSPRETFAFLARHHVGEGLALFYEEFSAWLESAGRWTQADEVYRLGIDREARPAERLIRKYSEFQRRYDQRTQDNGPSSPALPAVRPALAAKIDPFAASAPAATEQQAPRPTSTSGSAPKTKSGKAKMAIFSDTNSAASQPPVSGETKGWDTIGSMQERRKENKVEAKPWAGETLKAGRKAAPTQKMAIFRDESNLDLPLKEEMQSKQVPEHRVREAINPRTGRRERVFVNLDAVYPDYKNPSHEVSFEELRAIYRGWMDMKWHAQKEPLKQISGNASQAEPYSQTSEEHLPEKGLPELFDQKLSLKDIDPRPSQPALDLEEGHDVKASKARKLKVREVKEEPQTIKMKFDSPTGAKVRRKSTAEPTMTIHTRAATDEIYSIFNQPLKAESQNVADSSDFEDDDYTSAGESTGTGRISAASSDFGDDETTFHKSFNERDEGDFYDNTHNTHAETVIDGEWTRLSATKDLVDSATFHSQEIDSTHSSFSAAEDNVLESSGVASPTYDPERQKFVPQMPDDYHPPCGPYRDPEVMAQNRLPFMTPIVERTEYSIPSMTVARNNLYSTKTPSKPQMGNLLSSPRVSETPYQEQGLPGLGDDVTLSPTVSKVRSSPMLASPAKMGYTHRPLFHDAIVDPSSSGVRKGILYMLHDTAEGEFSGYRYLPVQETHHASRIDRFIKASEKRTKSGGEESFDVPILELPWSPRTYIIRRKLGAGAFGPVYLAESVETLSSDSEVESASKKRRRSSKIKRSKPDTSHRHNFEAIKLEVGKPSHWEFYMIRTAHARLAQIPELSRATDSIVRAHEMFIFKGESVLIEDYRGQGTLLDLLNLIRNEPTFGNTNPEGGCDEALAMFFTIELFRTVEALHRCGLMHGDIKADNCLVRFDDPPPANPSDEKSVLDPREVHYSPSGSFGWRSKGLCLIDFGRGIDMRPFIPSVQFTVDWGKCDYECPEIREKRPWTYQLDLYGLAGTVHAMLFGKYIESMPVNTTTPKTYRIREPLKRYWERDIWNEVFDVLLNPGSEKWAQMEDQHFIVPDQNPQPVRPVLNSMKCVREKMENWLLANAEKRGLSLQIRKLEAFLAEKKKRLEK